MRNPLNKRKIQTKYFGLLLIFVCTIMIGTGFLVVMESVSSNLKETEETNHVEDGYIELMEELPEDAILHAKQEGILLEENSYQVINEFDKDAKIYVFPNRKNINQPSVFEGKLPEKDNEIAIDRLFAMKRHLEVGDTVFLKEEEFVIVGTIALPDYNSLFSSAKDLVMDPEHFGVALVSEAGMERFDQNARVYRYSYSIQEASAQDVDAIVRSLREDGIRIQDYVPQESNPCISFIWDDIGKDGPVLKVFIYILIVIIGFVLAILTNNTIDSEATIIGTLCACGYYKREIVWHYLRPTIFVAFAGCVIGNLLGYFVMCKPFESMYFSIYSLPPMKVGVSVEALIYTTIIPMALMIFVTWFMVYRKLSLPPLRFLQHDLKRKKAKKALKIPAISFMRRFGIRVFIQNKANYVVLFLGIFLSSFLLMFGFGLKPLISHYVEEMDQTLPYEYQYYLKQPQEVEGESAEAVQVYTFTTWFELGQMDLDTAFMGVDENSMYFKEIELPQQEDEITLSKPLANKLGMKEGDVITFTDPNTERDYEFRVASVSDYSSTLCVFMKREQLNHLLGQEADAYNCYLSNEKLDIAEENLYQYVTRDDLIQGTEQMMETFSGVITWINLFSILIYFVFMYILTKIVIEKNAIHISLMKVFGYEKKEIGRLYLHPTTVMVLLSLLICIPLEIVCFKYTLVYISSLMEAYLEFYLPMWVYLAIVAIGILTYFGIYALIVRKIQKIPMEVALKNRE